MRRLGYLAIDWVSLNFRCSCRTIQECRWAALCKAIGQLPRLHVNRTPSSISPLVMPDAAKIISLPFGQFFFGVGFVLCPLLRF
jgi:hypothetical protein